MEHDEACALAPEGLPDPIGGDDVIVRIQVASGNDDTVARGDCGEGRGEVIPSQNLLYGKTVRLQRELTRAVDIMRPHHLPQESLKEVGLLIG